MIFARLAPEQTLSCDSSVSINRFSECVEYFAIEDSADLLFIAYRFKKMNVSIRQ